MIHTCNPSCLGGWDGRIEVGGETRQVVHETPISKITRAKWTEGVAQAVEYLFGKCEALSSNHSLTLKKEIYSSAGITSI
jgi:hypothetical protein